MSMPPDSHVIKTNKNACATPDLFMKKFLDRCSLIMTTVPSSSDDPNVIMSLALSKITGLYYIINRDTVRLGGRNAYHVIVTAMIAYTVCCLSLTLFGAYRWMNDTTQLILQFVAFSNFSLGCFKAFTMVRHARDIRECLGVARIERVGSVAQESADSLRRCRAVTSTFVVWFTTVNYCVLIAWTVLPFLTEGTRLVVKNRDGSFSEYHSNPFNMYFLASSDTYNRFYVIFHALEWLVGFGFVLFMVLFDTFMVAWCVTITGQLRVIAAAYEKLGHGRTAIDSDGVCITKDSKKYVEDLKLIIVYNQETLRKMNHLYNLLRPIILPQLAVASFTIISLSYIIILNYFNGVLFTSVQSLKICSLPTFVCQLYYTCIIFENLNCQKNIMNVALYSSNWTEMEIRFKKLILLAMKMNNSNTLNMKLTEKLIINLELFARIMRLCYSIYSVLVNYQLKINKQI